MLISQNYSHRLIFGLKNQANKDKYYRPSFIKKIGKGVVEGQSGSTTYLTKISGQNQQIIMCRRLKNHA